KAHTLPARTCPPQASPPPRLCDHEVTSSDVTGQPRGLHAGGVGSEHPPSWRALRRHLGRHRGLAARRRGGGAVMGAADTTLINRDRALYFDCGETGRRAAVGLFKKGIILMATDAGVAEHVVNAILEACKEEGRSVDDEVIIAVLDMIDELPSRPDTRMSIWATGYGDCDIDDEDDPNPNIKQERIG